MVQRRSQCSGSAHFADTPLAFPGGLLLLVGELLPWERRSAQLVEGPVGERNDALSLVIIGML